MLRFVGRRVQSVVRSSIVPRSTAVGVQNVRASHDGPEETEEEFNTRYTNYLGRPELSAWEIRSVWNTLAGKNYATTYNCL